MKFKETETVELKKTTSELKEAVISISAILNKHGKGTLYFGITDDGKVVGQQIGKSTLRDITKSITDHMDPKIYPDIKIEKSETYVNEHINWRADLSGSRRQEIPEIPVRAIKEAIINSLCHRDFTNPKSNEIAIYRDRIEIYNPGQFPYDHSPEEFISGKGKSIPRNPLIADTFYLAKDIERWGSGLKRIAEECKTAGVRVKFEKIKPGFQVIFYRPDIAQNQTESKVTEKVTENQRKILDYVSKNKHITAQELAGIVSISERKIKENIKKLKEKGLLRRIGPDKGGYWKIS